MAITTTGSQAIIFEGTNEAVANYIMISGLGPHNITGFGVGAVGSSTIIYFG